MRWARALPAPPSRYCPAKPDLRQLRFEVQHTRIADPALAQELQDFVNDCYGPSRARLKRLGSDISEEQSREVDWVGSSFLPHYTGLLRPRSFPFAPRRPRPYDASRDDGLSDTGSGGYPACKEWWSDGDTGAEKSATEAGRYHALAASAKLGQSKEEAKKRYCARWSARNMQMSQGRTGVQRFWWECGR